MRTAYKILLGLGLLFVAAQMVRWWLNPSELVSFQGKNVPIAEVLNSFSKQTGRTILYPESLAQKVTIDFDKVPLEDALQIATDQAELSQTRLFILAPDSKSRNAILENARKQTEMPVLLRMGRGSRWMNAAQPGQQGTVTYAAAGKDVANVVAELNLNTDSYFYYGGQAKPVTVDWKQKPVRDAAKELASMTDTDAERLYQVFQRETQQAERPRRGGGQNFIQEWMDRTAEQVAALPPAERAAAEEQLKAQQERFREFANMTDEQRMQRFMQRFMEGDPEQRLIRRLKNSTAESRAQRYKRWEARRQAQGSGTPAPAPVPQKQSNP